MIAVLQIRITTFVIPFVVRMNCLVAVVTYIMLQNTQYPLVQFIIKVLAMRLWVFSLDKAKLSYKEIVIEESKRDCGMLTGSIPGYHYTDLRLK